MLFGLGMFRDSPLWWFYVHADEGFCIIKVVLTISLLGIGVHVIFS